MSLSNLKYRICLVLLFSLYFIDCKAQDESNKSTYFGGSFGLTNNGIALLPTFSLNKPAGFLMLNVGNRFTFEPEFHFSLEGKPWTILLWGRYKLLQGEKFKLNVGAHPGLLFQPQMLSINGAPPSEVITTERYLAGELVPNYFFTPNTSIGLYYLNGNGFAESSSKRMHFLTLNANFRKINLSENYYLRFNPQIYYLNMDKTEGFFTSSIIALARNDFPVAIQMLTNKSFKTDFPDTSDWMFSFSLIYSFGKNYNPASNVISQLGPIPSLNIQ